MGAVVSKKPTHEIVHLDILPQEQEQKKYKGEYVNPTITFSNDERILGSVFKDPRRNDRVTVYQNTISELKGKLVIMFEFKEGANKETIMEYLRDILFDFTEKNKSVYVYTNFHTPYKKIPFDKYTFEAMQDYISMLVKVMTSFHTVYHYQDVSGPITDHQMDHRNPQENCIHIS